MKIFTVVALSTLMLSSCGDKKKDYSGTLGSCTTSIPSIMEICVEYSYTAKDQKDDPKATALSQMETVCTGSSGTWSATGTCATPNSLGTCTSTSTSGDATVSVKMFYYTGGAVSAGTVEATCAESGGTYAAP